MPEGEGGQTLPYAGTPEMDALFAQISQQPQMLSVVGQNPELLAEVMKHAGLNTDANQLIDMVSDWPDEAAQASIDEGAPVEEEVAPAVDDDDEVVAAEDEAEAVPPTADDTEMDPDTQEAATTVPPSGSSPMARGNNPIDDLISAQMMQSAVGNPNAPVPQGMQAGRQQRPAIPQSRMAPSGNPNQEMIRDIFRKQGAGKNKNIVKGTKKNA